jgi:rRNA processing protein Krr1/Pno1
MKGNTMRVSDETAAALGQEAKTYEARKKVQDKKGKGRTNITYYMEIETHRRLKQYAFEKNTSMQQVITQALDEFFASKGGTFIDKAGGDDE